MTSNTNMSHQDILNPIEIVKDIYVFSSILDNISKVRIIVFSTLINIKNISCTYGVNDKLAYVAVVRNYKGVHSNYFNLICTNPLRLNAKHIYIAKHKLSLYNNYNKIKYNLALCLTTLFSFSDYNRIVEFIEYYLHFGVAKFIVYNTNCSKKVQKILNYYYNNGFMDIIYDNFTHNLYERKRFHVWKQNDCFYRYRYVAKRIIFTDHDEILYSPKYYSDKDLFSHLNNYAASFHFYPLMTITKGKGFFLNDYYSICPNDTWKFVINNCNCVEQIVVHDIILYNNRKCFKEIVSIKDGFIIHARNNHSRHSKVCKKWKYISDFQRERKKLNLLINILATI